jgi:cobalt-zinc-cadmium efflux system outer membrane protein
MSTPLVRAQESDIPSSLTLDEAVRLAMDRNPALAAAKNEIQAAEGDRIDAGSRPNPSFSLEFEDLPLGTDPGPFLELRETTSRVEYEIETGGRRRLRAQAADRTLETKKLQHLDRVRKLRLEVERAFYKAVLAESNLETSQSILEQVERVIALNRVRFEQGDISALDLNRIEVEKLKFRDDLFQADLALRNANSSLLALLNAQDLSRGIDVKGSLPVDYADPDPGLPLEASLDELIHAALKKRPDLAAGMEEIKRAETESRLQRASRFPNITVGGGYRRNTDGNAVVFGVTVPLHIFNRNEGGIVRAEAERARAANLSAALEKEVQLEVQTAYDALEINRRRVEYIRTQQLNRAEEASRVTLQSYELGGATLIDYLDAQRTYRDALRIYNQALYDERISLCELSGSIGSGVQ